MDCNNPSMAQFIIALIMLSLTGYILTLPLYLMLPLIPVIFVVWSVVSTMTVLAQGLIQHCRENSK